MCGRFTLTAPTYEAIAQAFRADFDPSDAVAYRPRYNVAPMNSCPVVVREDVDSAQLVLSWAAWGIQDRVGAGHGGARVHINARVETVASLRTFRESFALRRCVVPADGFYEWSGAKGHRKPIRFHRGNGALFGMAAVYEIASGGGEGAPTLQFAILTTSAIGGVTAVHDRMPVLMGAQAASKWVAGSAEALRCKIAEGRGLCELLEDGQPTRLVATRASTRVNNTRNDDPDCLLADPDLFGG